MRPALDPEIAELLANLPLVPQITPELLTAFRAVPSASPDDLLNDRDATRREFVLPVADGTELPLTVLSPAHVEPGAPCVFWLHGGGMIMGDRFSQLDIPLDWLDAAGAVVVTVDYRLAPEHPGTTPVEDCYQGLLWVVEHATELGIDPGRIVVAGASAGGGLAAGVTLMARDLGTPGIAAQILIGPMLDHRNDTISSHQHSGEPGVWTRETNAFAWGAVLGGLPYDRVTFYVSPSLARDLSRLPPTYLDAGTAEVFRDESAAYAVHLWSDGVPAELHLWSGGCHGFDALFPDAELSVAARETRTRWLLRVLNGLNR
jgi:acetyl esterase/lipase